MKGSEAKPMDEVQGIVQSITIVVKGMDCTDETRVIERKLKSLVGVHAIEFNLMIQQVKVSYEPAAITAQKIKDAIEETGMESVVQMPGPPATEIILKIDDLCCADEEQVIEKKLKSLEGIAKFEINVMNQQVRITYNPATTSAQDIIKAIAETGMKASFTVRTEKQHSAWWKEKPQMLSLVISGILTITSLVLGQLDVPSEIVLIGYGAAIVIGIYFPAKMGVLALKTGTLNIRLLMVIGAIGAILLGLWEEAALLVVIYSLGDVLEAYAVDRARGAIKGLMQLMPKEARVRRQGVEMTLPTDEIIPGDTVVVRPGEKVPIDGTVAAGSTFIDQSPITGESVPVEKKEGDGVFAGTINQRGSIEFLVTRRASDTTLARIIHTVEEAQAKKTRYQRFGEKFGKYYTPIMLCLGLAIAFIPPLFFGAPWPSYVYRGLVIFVVSCSCGLALSVPVSVVSATANGARNGILFRGGAYFEVARAVRAIAFDKTGTLTIGRPTVTDVISYNHLTGTEVLTLAGCIESRSEHPIAEAIVRKAKEQACPIIQDFRDFISHTGLGVQAKIIGTTYYVGSDRFMQDHGISIKGCQEDVNRLTRDGKTVVLVGTTKTILGSIAVTDNPRPEARETITVLKEAGMKVVMLTGDNDRTARAIALQLGMDEVWSQLLPEGKVEAVKKIRQQFGTVAMVGDGINDAPAMAVADLGIAMGAAGTDVARETGDVVLMADDLSKLPHVFKMGKKTVNNMRLNVIASLLIIAILVPMALIGNINLTLGLVLNEGGALVVIVNALRMLTGTAPRVNRARHAHYRPQLGVLGKESK